MVGNVNFCNMENNKLWQNKTFAPMRQPKQNLTGIVDKSSSSQDNSKPGKSDKEKMDEIVAKSKLNFDAPEFKPKYCETKSQVSTVTSSIQNRLNIHRSESNEQIEEPTSVTSTYVGTESDIKRIKQIINTLTKDPGQFDNLLQIFMETVAPYLEDVCLLPEIVQIIVNEVSILTT